MELPSRRDEGWRWSDLRAAVGDMFDPRRLRDASHPLEALAQQIVPITAPPGERREIEHLLHEPLVFDIDVGENAEVIRTLTHVGGDAAENAFCLTRVRLQSGASYRQFVVTEGAGFTRIETQVDIEGEGAVVELNGVYMVGEGRHADLTSIITHSAAGSQTRQLIKGVARARGRGVFQGKIEVGRGAQQTDARQHHAGLMLDEGAEIFAKPELMIFADDVSCAHGNTVGALDADALFYMRARGLPEATAKALLVEAFLAEAVPAWMSEPLRDDAMDHIRRWLGGEQ